MELDDRGRGADTTVAPGVADAVGARDRDRAATGTVTLAGDDDVVIETAAPDPLARPGWTRWVEPVLAGLLTLVSLVFLVRYLAATRRLSLWTDELFSILTFGQHGPYTAATDYSSANNHVLVTIFGAATPGNLLTPWRPRLISYAAILAMTAALIWELARRRHFLLGSLVVGTLSLNVPWIDQSYTARGYGLMAAATVFWCLAAWRYLDDPRRRWLAVMGVAALAGVWTIPSFVFFVGPAWLALLAILRRRDVLVAGALTVLAIVAVYAKVAGELVTAFRNYGDEFGRSYVGITRPLLTMRLYLFNKGMVGFEPPTWLIGVIVVSVLGAAIVTRARTPDRKFGQVLAAATVIFLGICVLLQTPIDRTVAFVLIPFLLVATVLGGVVLARPSVARWRPLIAVLVLVPVLALATIRTTRDLRVQPVEDWQGQATLVNHLFPTSMPIEVRRNPNYLAAYVGPPRVFTFQQVNGRFAVGGSALIDIYAFDGLPPHTDVSRFAPVAELRLPQQLGLYSRILAVRPNDSGLARLTVNGSTVDPDARRDLSGLISPAPILDLLAEPKAGTRTRSLMLTTTAGPTPVDLSSMLVSAEVTTRDGRTRVVPARNVQTGPDTVAVILDDQEVASVHVTVAGPLGNPPTLLRGAWMYAPA